MNKPLLEDMMKSLYYLYTVGFEQLPHIEHILEEFYNVRKFEITESKFICYEYGGNTTSIII